LILPERDVFSFVMFTVHVFILFIFNLHSEGNNLKKLILSDLYYHLQGDLEGRKVAIGPFKELSQYLVESNILGTYLHQFNDDFSASDKNVYLFDLARLRADLGLNVLDCSE